MLNREIGSLILLYSIREECKKYDIGKTCFGNTDGNTYKKIDEWTESGLIKMTKNKNYIPNYEKIRFILKTTCRIMTTLISIADDEENVLTKIIKE